MATRGARDQSVVGRIAVVEDAEFDAAPESVGVVRRRLVNLASAQGVADGMLGGLALAVGEAVANVVVHAYDEGEKGRIHIQASIADGMLSIVIADTGHGFRPRGSAGLGLGLGLIAQSSLDFAIGQNHPRGTVVRMRFAVVPASPDAQTRAEDQALPGTDAAVREASASRGRLIAAGDRERKRLALDLHDGAQQRLVVLRIRLDELTEQMLGESSEDVRRRLQLITEELDEALSEIRDFAHGVYPSVLAVLGPAEALRAVAQGAPIATRVTAEGLVRHGEDLERAVYFSCLEALQNAFKHAAGATRVTIALHEYTDALTLEVSDDGRGFDPSRVANGGIANMADRLAAFGGQLSVRSSPGNGTRVLGRVPLPPPSAA